MTIQCSNVYFETKLSIQPLTVRNVIIKFWSISTLYYYSDLYYYFGYIYIYVRQPHQTSDMLTTFKMIFFCIFENVDDLASKCKNNYGAITKIGKVRKDYVQKG